MAVTPTNLGGNSQTTSATGITASGITAGVGDVVWASIENINKSVSSVSDSASNPYTKVGEITVGSNTLLSVWRSKLTNALSAGTISADWSAAGSSARSSISINSVASGVLASAVEDQVPTPTTATTAAVSIGPTGTLAQADELVMVWVGNNGNSTGNTITWGSVSGGTGLTALDAQHADSGTSFHDQFVGYGESASTTALTLSGTISAAPKHWVCVAATYKVASGGTTFNVAVTTGTVSLATSVQRQGKLAISASAVAAGVSVVRRFATTISTGAVSLAASVKRKAVLSPITTGAVAASVTVATKLVKIITITTGTVAAGVTLSRKGLVNVKPTVAASVTLVRKGLLNVKPTVAATPTIKRKGFVAVASSGVAAVATVVRKGLVGIVTSAVSAAANVVALFIQGKQEPIPVLTPQAGNFTEGDDFTVIRQKQITLSPSGTDGSATANGRIAISRPGIVKFIQVNYTNQAATTDLTMVRDSSSGVTIFTATNVNTTFGPVAVATDGVDEANGTVADIAGMPFTNGLYFTVAQANNSVAGAKDIVVTVWIEV